MDLLEEAARGAVRKGAADSAVAYLRRALEEPPPPDRRPRLLFELGLVEAGTSGPDALEHLREAYETLEDERERIEAAFWVTRLLLFTGQPDAGIDFAVRARHDAPPEFEDEDRALEALELTAIYFGGGDPAALDRMEAYRGRPESRGPGAKMLAAMAALDWAARGGGAEECAALAIEALADGVLIEAENGHFTVTASVPLVLAEREEAMESYDAQLVDAHRRGSLFAALAVHLWRGWALLLRGELRDSEASIREAYAETVLYGLSEGIGIATAVGYLVQNLVEQGRLEEARTEIDRIPPATAASFGGDHWRRGRLELLLAEGRHEEALAAAAEYRRLLQRTDNPALAPWRTLTAHALDGHGRTDEAIALAEEELEPARRWGAPGAIGRTLRILGTLKRDEGLGELEQAVELLERSKARAERARALAALGGALRRARRPTDARDPLRRALELADAVGAQGLVEEVRTELAAAGVQPRTTALSGVQSLTASERRVATLAAEGQTKRDIAQTRYVTPKTVEVHLSNAYRKLGIKSRRELSGALAAD